MTEVIDLNERKKNRKKNSERPAKLSLSELCEAFARTINGANILPEPFPVRYYVHDLGDGARCIVALDEQEQARMVSDEEFLNVLIHYSFETLRDPALQLTHRPATEVLKAWRHMTEPLDDIPYVRWASDPGPTWHRLPFDLVPDPIENLCPTWGSLLGRIDSSAARDALCAWIGSLLVPESYRQQYVWIHGGGGNGKGAIARFLHRLFGRGSHFLSNVPKEPNQFWTAQLVKKRLIVVPDCENYHFPTSGLFKTISGGDPITVEPKQKAPFTTILDAKFLFTSNQLPSLHSVKADLRRAIFAKLDGGGEWSEDFESRLWAEGGAFLWHCLRLYAQYCPKHGPIPVDHDASELTNWVETLEEDFQVCFDEWFEPDPKGQVEGRHMQAILCRTWAKRGKQLDFIKWMDRTYHIQRKTVDTPDGKRNAKRYCAVRLKKLPFFEAGDKVRQGD